MAGEPLTVGEESLLLDTARTERLLASFAALTGLSLWVEDAGGGLLAGSTAAAEAERAPIELPDRRLGYAAAPAGLPGAPAAAALLAELLAERAFHELELEGMTEELLGKYEESTLLYDLSSALGSTFDVPAVCGIALDKALQVIEAAKAFVVLAGEDGRLSVPAARAADGLAGTTMAAGTGISGYVAASGRQLLLHAEEPAPAGVTRDGTAWDAVLSVPLAVSGGETIGAMTLTGRRSDERFTAGDAKLASAIAAQLATAIHSSRLVATLREAERVQREVEIAAGIQRSLLPAGAPELPGLALAGLCLPAANVGGDYYDFLADDRGRLTLVIADVAGHSIGSALMMAMARAVLRREIAAGGSPAGVLAATNRGLFDDLVNAGLFITMFCVRYDPATRGLVHANAGHNLPLLRRADGETVELDADGAAIGILKDVEFEEQTVLLRPGDTLLLYTDGIVEAPSPDGEPFGDERLRRLVADAGPIPPAGLAALIDVAVRSHTGGAPQRDDVTFVALQGVEA